VAPLTTTFLASTLAVANFDAAGGVDIAVAGLETVNFQFQMSVFTNQSDVFTLENDYFLEPASGSSAESLAAGDFNEDGVPDLAGVVTINNRDYTHIWLAQPNTGGTLLSTPSRVHSGGTTDDLAVADLNNDGHLDAAITFNGGYFGRLNGAGDGTLQVLPNGATDFAAAVAGDVNGDGREDLVAYVQDLTSPDPVQDTDRFDVYLRNVDGTLPSSPNFTFDATSTTQQLALADMDGDQTLDLVVGTRSSRVDIHTNPGGNGNFSTSPTEINVPGFRVFEIAFVNGDTFPDIVTNDNGTIPPGMTVALSNSVLNYSTSEIPTTNAVSDLRFAFFDDDANIDIVTAQGNEGVGVLLGDGTGSFTENLFDVNGGSHVETLDVGLLNADASLDVVTSGNDTFRLFGNGSGGLGTASMLTGPSFDDPTQTWIVDADLDGILDVLVTEGTAYGVTAYRGTGSGNFEPADNSFFHLGGEPVGARNGFLFDSDGDGVREPNFAVSVDASGTLVSVLVLLLLIGLRVWVYRRRVGLPA
ncbi:MAG: VCBS repeat-containing protein, partial [Candidatus Eremiobacteraeota bacterium]|nr:VCBS repeat-containing protein [Candidatus Eremiobacteraeota bacterium]